MMTDVELDNVVRQLIAARKDWLCLNTGTPIEIEEIDIVAAMHHRGDRFHKPITVHYRQGGQAGVAELWLKFRPGLDAVYPLLEAYDRRLSDSFFPKPFFSWHSSEDDSAFIVTERVDGETLRDKLFKEAIFGRADRLMPIFMANGRNMRRFHEAFDPTGSIPVTSLTQDIRRLVMSSTYISPREKPGLLQHVDRQSAVLEEVGFLPVLKIHNDWILKNVVVDRRERDHIVDCDSMRAPNNLRWYDPVYFLINIESQLKWSPLVRKDTLSKLWDSFWRGYLEGGLPDYMDHRQIAAAFFLLRVQYLLGGTIRVPLYEMFGNLPGRRFVKKLKSTVLNGRNTLLADMSGPPH
jgi:hypothetical protein